MWIEKVMNDTTQLGYSNLGKKYYSTIAPPARVIHMMCIFISLHMHTYQCGWFVFALIGDQMYLSALFFPGKMLSQKKSLVFNTSQLTCYDYHEQLICHIHWPEQKKKTFSFIVFVEYQSNALIHVQADI